MQDARKVPRRIQDAQKVPGRIQDARKVRRNPCRWWIPSAPSVFPRSARFSPSSRCTPSTSRTTSSRSARSAEQYSSHRNTVRMDTTTPNLRRSFAWRAVSSRNSSWASRLLTCRRRARRNGLRPGASCGSSRVGKLSEMGL